MKRLKSTAVVLLFLFVILSVFPYLVPLSSPNDVIIQPFENSNNIVIDDVQIHYRVFEPVTMEPTGKVLMVHGLGGSTYSFEKNAQVIADEGYHVVLVDLPGFGYSHRLDKFDHSQENRSELLWKFVGEIDLGLNEEVMVMKWHLAGHSMGGGTVAAMAALNPTNTESLILIDAALFETNQKSIVSKYPPVTRWLQVALERVFIKRKFISDFLASAYGHPPTEEDVTGYLKPLEISGTARSLNGFINTSRNMEIERVKDIQTPVLIVWGENDSWIPVEDAYKIYAMFDHSKLEVIENAGHCPMETHSNEFNAFLITWLSDYN